jgi:hypothetical protein
MPAKLHIEGTFRLKPRAVFVVHGRLVEGTIRVGQRVIAPQGLDAPVIAIEYVRTVTGRRENPAVCFEYRDDEQYSVWESLQLVGQTLELGGES